MGLGPDAAALALSEYFALESFGLKETILSLGPEEFLGLSKEKMLPLLDKSSSRRWLADRDKFQPQAQLAAIKKASVQIIPLGDESYPERLLEMEDPPLVLFLLGQLPDPNTLCLGIVGTRHPDQYGERLAAETARSLTRRGVCIVSGAAMGVDSIAHENCVKEGGSTIGVLGQGVLFEAPSRQQKLFREILNGSGALLSEYSPFTTPEPFRFPHRNRVIAGLSQAVVVIQARSRSGTKITAQHALEQGKEVFVFPGSVYSDLAKGCHELIREGASFVSSVQDILQDLRVIGLEEVSPDEAPPPTHLKGHKEEIYKTLTREPQHIDSLCEKSGMSAASASSALLMLEMEGLATQSSPGYYLRLAGGLIGN